MQIYLPIAEMTVPVESVLLLGAVVGFLSGVFGIGGGFLTTPFLIFLGIPPAIAVGTQTNQIVAAGVAGASGHWRRGNVDVKIGAVMLGGGILGSVVGVFIFKFLKYLGQIDFAISILYVVLLGLIGILMLVEWVNSFMQSKSHKREFNKFRVPRWMAGLPYKMRFPKSRLYMSALAPIGIGFVIGIFSAVLGIGGGFMLVPAMIYILGMPPLLAAGTSLFQILFITGFSTVMHASINHTVDVVLAVLLIIGSVIGAHFGVMVARMIKGSHARLVLAILVLTVSLQLASQLIIQPAELYSTTVR